MVSLKATIIVQFAFFSFIIVSRFSTLVLSFNIPSAIPKRVPKQLASPTILHMSPPLKPPSPIKTSSSRTSLTYINGISEIVDSYSTFLLDMWGVMHDGSTTYEGVLDTIQQLKQRNKTIIILSNSSKRLHNSIKMLTKLGFDPIHDFEMILTSGDVSHRMLSGGDDDESLQCSKWTTLQTLKKSSEKKVFVFGSGEGDEEYIASCGWKLSSIEEANLIVARGTFTINDGSGDDDGGGVIYKTNKEEEYWNVMAKTLDYAAQHQIPMLVTNPDKVRPDKGLPPMPGAIGDEYETYLEKYVVVDDDGEKKDVVIKQLVKRIGKPYSEVYELALASYQNDHDDSAQQQQSAIMVGDALETDITGGTWAQIDTLWVVKDGIHAPYLSEDNELYEQSVEEVLTSFNEKKGYSEEDQKLRPSYVVKHFKW